MHPSMQLSSDAAAPVTPVKNDTPPAESLMIAKIEGRAACQIHMPCLALFIQTAPPGIATARDCIWNPLCFPAYRAAAMEIIPIPLQRG